MMLSTSGSLSLNSPRENISKFCRIFSCNLYLEISLPFIHVMHVPLSTLPPRRIIFLNYLDTPHAIYRQKILWLLNYIMQLRCSVPHFALRGALFHIWSTTLMWYIIGKPWPVLWNIFAMRAQHALQKCDALQKYDVKIWCEKYDAIWCHRQRGLRFEACWIGDLIWFQGHLQIFIILLTL